MSRYTISVRFKGDYPLHTYYCDNVEEVDTFILFFQDRVNNSIHITVVDREEVAKELVDHEPV